MDKKSLEKPNWAFYRIGEAMTVLAVSRSTFLAGVKNGLYPKPVKLSKRCSGWRVGDIKECAENMGR